MKLPVEALPVPFELLGDVLKRYPGESGLASYHDQIKQGPHHELIVHFRHFAQSNPGVRTELRDRVVEHLVHTSRYFHLLVFYLRDGDTPSAMYCFDRLMSDEKFRTELLKMGTSEWDRTHGTPPTRFPIPPRTHWLRPLWRLWAGLRRARTFDFVFNNELRRVTQLAFEYIEAHGDLPSVQ